MNNFAQEILTLLELKVDRKKIKEKYNLTDKQLVEIEGRDIHLELINYYEQYRKANLRVGQSAFNALYEVDEELANEIRGSKYDCYHKDENVGIIFNMFCEKYN